MTDSESGGETRSEVEDFAINNSTGELVNMKDHCHLCGKPVDKNAADVWKQVTGFVGGPKKDSMRLREDTGYFAHDACVAKVQEGQAIDQPGLFEV